jgi:hypothetical protein
LTYKIRFSNGAILSRDADKGYDSYWALLQEARVYAEGVYKLTGEYP